MRSNNDGGGPRRRRGSFLLLLVTEALAISCWLSSAGFANCDATTTATTVLHGQGAAVVAGSPSRAPPSATSSSPNPPSTTSPTPTTTSSNSSRSSVPQLPQLVGSAGSVSSKNVNSMVSARLRDRWSKRLRSDRAWPRPDDSDWSDEAEDDDGEGETLTDMKTLAQELENENVDPSEPANKCSANCSKNQALCPTSCTCIELASLCDGKIDCEHSDDEINCDTIVGVHYNGSCLLPKRPRKCPFSLKCIAEEWVCDGQNDCGDYSDEAHCNGHKNCTAEQFECMNGLCIPQNWTCDGEDDCKDYSDEENCKQTFTCADNEFTCGDGTCIQGSKWCDGHPDCRDGLDEQKCESPLTCKESQFRCETYPRCISKEYLCDGDVDCDDESDEDNCQPANATCKPDEFRCISGKCISGLWRCDKQIDCRDGDDEKDCAYAPPKNCTDKEFACNSGLCIMHDWVCDGVPDCQENEDEMHCKERCEVTQYHCQPNEHNHTGAPISSRTTFVGMGNYNFGFRECIDKKRLCDGYNDCPNGDDEENCFKVLEKCEDAGLHAKCEHRICIVEKDGKPACACNPGYYVANDTFSCLDVNECEFKEPVCSQICRNTLGSFVCSCKNGFVLRPDGRTCKAIGANPMLLLVNRIDIRMVSITAPKYSAVVKNLENAIALDYHYKKGILYWSDVTSDIISRAYMNGSGVEEFIRWGLETPGGIAVDWIHDLIFWTDSGTRRVEVATLDNRVRHVIVANDVDKPRGIAVHPHEAFVFWSDYGPNPKIERADMDGSNRMALVRDGIFWPNGLSIDYTEDKLYWADAKYRVIEAVDLHGHNRKKIVTRGLYHPFSVTVFEDLIYWDDWHFKSISSANKVTGREFKTIHSGLYFPMDLHSYHPQRQPDYPNHCGKNNGNCSHMCLPNRMGYSCVCPVSLKIKSDKKTCQSTAEDLLIFARKRDLRLMSLEQPSRMFDTVIPVDNVQSAVALSWDSDDTIYWTDVDADTISRAHLDGKNQQTVIRNNLESPAGLAVDWVTKKLYWTDAGTNRIECSNLDGSMRTLLIYEGLDRPRDIVVDPFAGTMYWSDWGKHPKIESSYMDGTHRRTIHSKDLIWPNGLALDFDKHRLYWTDGGQNRIEYSDYNGNNRRVLISNNTVLQHPFGLAIHKNTIYWTDWDTFSISRADKDTGANIGTIKSNVTGLMDVRVFHRNRKTIKKPCGKNNGNCSHLCLLAGPQKITCACPTGIALASDNKTCPEMPSTFLIMAHGTTIRVLSFDTNYTANTVLPIQYMRNTSGVDVDLKTGQVFWTDAGQPFFRRIKRMSFNGQNEETIIDSCIDVVNDLVVDSIGRKLYWTDAGLKSIEVSELDGSSRRVLVYSGQSSPRAIAVNYRAGLLFWVDWAVSPRIDRADMDGNRQQTIVTGAIQWPHGLAVDSQTNRIFWTDAKRNIIESADFNGDNIKIIVQNIEFPFGLTIFNDFVYWSDWKNNSLFRAKKEDGSLRKKVLSNLEGMMDVKAVNMRDILKTGNVCGSENGGCSHLCLRNSTGYSCACPTGIVLNSDERSCNDTPQNFLIIAARKTLVRISLDTPEMWEVPLRIKDVHTAYAVDFHYKAQLIFYTDIDLNVIKCVNIRNLTDVRVIVQNNTSPFRLAVDWVANNIYWTDMHSKKIEVARLNGEHRKVILDDLKEPISVALFPKEGYIYWTEWGANAKIRRAYLDGSGAKDIISTDLNFPNDITIDFDARKIFWADAMRARIEVADVHGRYRMALVNHASDVFGLTQFADRIYWGDWFKEHIDSASKFTGKGRIKIRTSLDRTTGIQAVSESRQPGWNPCVMSNGGCSHLCFFVRKNYTCGCPDIPDSRPCLLIPSERMPMRKPGTIGDPNYDIIDDEEPPATPKGTWGNGSKPSQRDSSRNNGNEDEGPSITTVVLVTLVLMIVTLLVFFTIVYMYYQNKNQQQKYVHDNRRNVLTFSNPNYYASGSADNAQTTPASVQAQDAGKKGFIWKRLRYDKSQSHDNTDLSSLYTITDTIDNDKIITTTIETTESTMTPSTTTTTITATATTIITPSTSMITSGQERVYEDSGQSSSPEVVSLIPPSSTTPNSSRAASITPMDSSPPAITRVTVQRLQPSIIAGPKPRMSNT